jgi:hypothetical protein
MKILALYFKSGSFLIIDEYKIWQMIVDPENIIS